MASTYSTNLKIELQATGENSGTWGTITNTNLGTALEQAIVGYGNPSFASDANLTLTYTDTNAAQAARALVLNVTSAVSLTGTRELVVPTIQKQYIVQNNTTGSQSITVKTSGGTGITVPNGRKAHLYVDGTNVIQMFDFVDINGGAIDGTTVGASSASTGAFTTLTASDAVTFSATTQNISLGASQTTGTFVLGGTAATGAITLDASTKTHTLNVGSGATENTLTKTINIGTSGVSGSTTTITVGSTSGTTTTINGAITASATTQNISLGASQTTGTFVLGGTAATGAITLDASTKTHTLGVGSGATESGATKTINIGTGGVATSTTTITIGSANGTTTTFNGTVNATTLDLTNLEVTNIKAKDGTASITLADSTGVATFSANPILNAGTANGVVYLNASKVATTGSALTFDGTNLAFGTVSAKINFATTGSATQNYVGVAADGFSLELTTQRGVIQPITYKQDYSAGHVWEVAGGEKMRLAGATGGVGALGIGYTTLTSVGDSGLAVLGNVGIGTNAPGAKLNVAGGNIRLDNNQGVEWGGSNNFIYGNETTDFVAIATNGNERLRLDSSGNLGLGVTPSASGALGYTKPIQLGNTGAIIAGFTSAYTAQPRVVVGANGYFDDSADTWKYIQASSAVATQYRQYNGIHSWHYAAAGTAGNTIAFTQAMTLDASGNLVVGATSTSYRMEVVAPSGDNITALFRSGDATAANNAGGGFRNVSSATATSRYAQVWLDADGANFSGGDYFYIQKNGNSGTVDFVQYSNAAMTFAINTTERARITSNGYFKASNDGNYVEATNCHELRTTEDARAVIITSTNASYTSDTVQIRAARNTTNNSFYAIAYYNTGAAAYKFRVADSGDVTNTNGTYGTISDQKMKTDIVDAGSQWADIKALRFRKFKMKDDPSGLVQLGVVAQEVELTSPGLVDEHTDRDAEGNDLGTTTKSVKTSVLLMKAAVALQEAMARIETLEAEVAALKGA